MILRKKLGAVFEKSLQIAMENIRPTLQKSQRQTPKLVTASNESVETFGKMNDSTNFSEVKRDADGDFSLNG